MLFVLAAIILVSKFRVIVLVGLEAPFAGQERIPLADEIEGATEHDRSEAPEHDRGKDLREHVSLRLIQDFRIPDRKRYRSFADAAGHNRITTKKKV